ncbi:MAG: hypothetical protein HY351_04600 [Candidatus Omnitrophica bacterium]|nr:hypothetical protein [Candidatus Omnitrophota bacterium]
MFKNIFNLSYQRNLIGALGFYIAYGAMFMVICIFLSICAQILFSIPNASNDYNFRMGYKIGQGTALILPLILSISIILKKKRGLGYFLFSYITFYLAFFGGGYLALIAPSLLTMLPNRSIVTKAPMEDRANTIQTSLQIEEGRIKFGVRVIAVVMLVETALTADSGIWFQKPQKMLFSALSLVFLILLFLLKRSGRIFALFWVLFFLLGLVTNLRSPSYYSILYFCFIILNFLFYGLVFVFLLHPKTKAVFK